MSSYAQLHARISRDAIRAHQAREAAEIRATYTHEVFYKGRKENCYLGTLADCEHFAAECGNCRVAPASRVTIDARADYVSRWRPYGG